MGLTSLLHSALSYLPVAQAKEKRAVRSVLLGPPGAGKGEFFSPYITLHHPASAYLTLPHPTSPYLTLLSPYMGYITLYLTLIDFMIVTRTAALTPLIKHTKL